MSEYVLELKGITKIFPGVKALNNVQFQLKPGEVHALMGENGAGKSTFIKVITGVQKKAKCTCLEKKWISKVRRMHRKQELQLFISTPHPIHI